MQNRISPLACALIALTLGLAPVSLAAQESHRVSFVAGNDNAAVDGKIKGDAYADYLLGASAGQTMAVSLIPGKSDGHGTIYFNIMPPNSSGEAIYNGSIDGLDATGVKLPANGDYTIRVYQMGDDADSGKTTAFTLSVSID